MDIKRNKYCAAFGCLNSKRKLPDLSFFSLPKDAERRREWLIAIEREDLLSKENLKVKSYEVCSDHFENSAIKTIKQLKSNAVPTKPVNNVMHLDDAELNSDDDISDDDSHLSANRTTAQQVPTQGDEQSVELFGEDCVCNACGTDITGAVYVCAQCESVTLCVSCEAVGRHAAHYVLRVPPGRSQVEVEAVVQRLRRVVPPPTHMPTIEDADEVKVEVKTEPDPEPDPLKTDALMAAMSMTGIETEMEHDDQLTIDFTGSHIRRKETTSEQTVPQKRPATESLSHVPAKIPVIGLAGTSPGIPVVSSQTPVSIQSSVSSHTVHVASHKPAVTSHTTAASSYSHTALKPSKSYTKSTQTLSKQSVKLKKVTSAPALSPMSSEAETSQSTPPGISKIAKKSRKSNKTPVSSQETPVLSHKTLVPTHTTVEQSQSDASSHITSGLSQTNSGSLQPVLIINPLSGGSETEVENPEIKKEPSPEPEGFEVYTHLPTQ